MPHPLWPLATRPLCFFLTICTLGLVIYHLLCVCIFKFSNFSHISLCLFVTLQAGELSHTDHNLGQNISGGRHSAPKVVGAPKLQAFTFLHTIQIAVWLRYERVSLHVNSLHAAFSTWAEFHFLNANGSRKDT